jgi:precorrin-2/cobalt-factor-2 C20-methyltransferase
MKVHRVLDRLVELLKSTDLMDRAVLVEKAGTAGQRTCVEIDKITEQPHYYSTIIVRKNPSTVRTLIN